MSQRGRNRGTGRAQGQKNTEEVPWRWPLPSDLRRALGDGNLSGLTNPGLLLQRYVPYATEWGWSVDKKNFKNQAWKDITSRLNELYINNDFLEPFLQRRDDVPQKPHDKQGYLKKLHDKQGYLIESFRAQVMWRLVVGLGLPSPLETGITLHHLYGFPYLPGSAIKGVTRAWRMQRIAEELGIPRLNAPDIKAWRGNKTPWKLLEELLMSPVPKDDDTDENKKKIHENVRNRLDALKKALNDGASFLKEHGYVHRDSPRILEKNDPEEFMQKYIHSFSRAFGSLTAQGEIIFFDAYPESLVVDTEGVKKGILELDVMNPHYSEYYTKDEPPADWLSPIPVFFLVVRKGTVFKITLAWRPPKKGSSSDGQELLKEVRRWTEMALQECGIGAKTRAGYGELRILQPAALPQERTSPVDPLAQLEASIARWRPSEMGTLLQLIQSIAQVSDAECRQKLAQQLQERLRKAGKWAPKYQGSPWYQALARLLGDVYDPNHMGGQGR